MRTLGFSAALAALDLFLKAKIEGRDQSEFPWILPHTGERIKILRVHNDGFPFGFMREHFQAVQLAAVAMTSVVAGMLFCLSRKKGEVFGKLALSLVLGGAVSNLFDRLARRYVVDYFSIDCGRLKNVVFNLGDIFVFFGTFLLVITGAVKDFKDSKGYAKG